MPQSRQGSNAGNTLGRFAAGRSWRLSLGPVDRECLTAPDPTESQAWPSYPAPPPTPTPRPRLLSPPAISPRLHNYVRSAIPLARYHNLRQGLSRVRIGIHDELFEAGRPVLVGCDADSTYCYLLSLEECRDTDTWGVRLLELVERGLCPEATI